MLIEYSIYKFNDRITLGENEHIKNALRKNENDTWYMVLISQMSKFSVSRKSFMVYKRFHTAFDLFVARGPI